MKESIVTQVIETLRELPENLQWRVLDFVQQLRKTGEQAIQGKQILQFAGSIPLEDLEAMQQAIDEECETIDLHEW